MRELTPEEEKKVVHDHLAKIGRKGGFATSSDKKHMAEIGRKGRAGLVRNIVEKAKEQYEREKERSRT